MYKLKMIDTWDSSESILGEFNTFDDCMYWFVFLKSYSNLSENAVYKINKKYIKY